MILDSKQPRIVTSARTILLHMCVSAFELGWAVNPVLGSGFKKPSADVYSYTVAAGCILSLQLTLGKKVPY